MALRNGLNEVYRPPSDIPPAAILVFVHGLFGGPEKTWTAFDKGRSRSPFHRPHTTKNTGAEQRKEQKERTRKGKEPTLGQARTLELGKEPSEDSRSGRLNVENESSHAAKVFWPRDLLPSVLPNVCIYSWGYDADVGHFLSSAGLNTVFQHAQNLLNDLAALRDAEENSALPLIFVCHSLSGLVVKDALNRSATTGNRRLQAILQSTFGICFLGTPHRGSKSASMGRRLYRLTEIVAAQRANTQLLRALETNSETLDRITRDFYDSLEKCKSLQLFSFAEEQEVRKLGFVSMIIVYPDSARVGHVNEGIGSIPANHRDMAKFSSVEDVGFVRVSKVLERWVKNIQKEYISSETYQNCISSLDDKTARARIAQVAERHAHSFEWLYDADIVRFRTWLADESYDTPLFWVTGKPGSGKSTLMRFAMQDPRIQSLLPHDCGPWHLAGYFFHDRGSASQKTLKGMLQELLFQVLRHAPDRFLVVQERYMRLAREQRKDKPEWDESTLGECLCDVLDGDIYSPPKNRPLRICFFVDALDEHAGENVHLLFILGQLEGRLHGNVSLGHDIRFKICLASRPWTIFMDKFADVPQFAIHEHTQHDIEVYTKDRLEHARNNTNGMEEIRALVEAITDKAMGVFIWVRIVVDEVCVGIRDGTAFFLLHDLVSRMPAELDELYARTLRKVDTRYVFEAHIMLQIALCALSPLSLRDLYCLTVASLYKRVELSEKQFADYLLPWLASRSAGLLEVMQQPLQETAEPSLLTLPGEPGPAVQFIHQTAKEHARRGDLALRYQDGWATLPQSVPNILGEPTQVIKKSGNIHILHSCIAIAIDAGPKCISAETVLEHVRLIDQEIDEGKSSPSYLSPLEARSIRPNGGMLYDMNMNVADWFNCLSNSSAFSISFAIASNIYNFPTKYTAGSWFLYQAALGPRNCSTRDDRVRMINCVLDWGAPIDEYVTVKDFLEMTYTVLVGDGFGRVELDPDQRFTALGALIITRYSVDERTCLTMARALLENGADPNRTFEGRERWMAMEICARHRSAEWVRLLSTYGAEWHISAPVHQALLGLRSGYYAKMWSVLGENGVVYEEHPGDSPDVDEAIVGPYNIRSAFVLPALVYGMGLGCPSALDV